MSVQTASAADCPGRPDALGTSRTLVVDPKAHPRIGIMQYAETLPLDDHELVLTFDDGPLPRYSNQILEILASQCVKATFFLVGRQAQANPEGVRKVRDAGHTVATHSQNHPSLPATPTEAHQWGCIRRPKPSRSRAGREFRVSSSPRRRCFPPPR